MFVQWSVLWKSLAFIWLPKEKDVSQRSRCQHHKRCLCEHCTGGSAEVSWNQLGPRVLKQKRGQTLTVLSTNSFWAFFTFWTWVKPGSSSQHTDVPCSSHRVWWEFNRCFRELIISWSLRACSVLALWLEFSDTAWLPGCPHGIFGLLGNNNKYSGFMLLLTYLNWVFKGRYFMEVEIQWGHLLITQGCQ